MAQLKYEGFQKRNPTTGNWEEAQRPYGMPAPYQPGQVVMGRQELGAPGAPAQGGAAGMGAGGPQFYGLEEGAAEGVRSRLTQQGMAAASADYGRRGAVSSSMYSQAAATVGVRSAAAALQLTQADNARRSSWELQRWQQQENSRRFATQTALQQQQMDMQRQQQRQQWNMYMGTLNAQSRQGMYDRYLNALGGTKGAVPQGQGGIQGQAQAQGQVQGQGQGQAPQRSRDALETAWRNAMQMGWTYQQFAWSAKQRGYSESEIGWINRDTQRGKPLTWTTEVVGETKRDDNK